MSYHKVREAVASGWLHFEHIASTENPADILTKYLPWFKLKIFVEPLLFWKGDPAPSRVLDTEGSDKRPGLDSARARDTEMRDSRNETTSPSRGYDGNGLTRPRETVQSLSVPDAHFLRGNRYAALYECE